MSSDTISLNALEHPIKAVTTFLSSKTAQVTRAFAVNLKSGSNVLEISGISSHVDKESPRIYGLGTDARVFGMSCSTKLANAPHKQHTKNAAAVKKLEAKRKVLTAERSVRQTEFDLLDDAARSLAQDKATSFDSLMDTFVGRKRNAMSIIIEMDEQIEELDQEIWLLNASHKGETAAVITATLLAKHDCKIEFQLTYLVTGVTWEPYYDLHASTFNGKASSDVSLHYCASITQNTGEDWMNTVLTLSTANSHALHIPKVDLLRLLPIPDRKTPRPCSALLSAMDLFPPSRLPPLQGAPVEDIREEDEGHRQGIQPEGTVSNKNPLSLAYSMVSLPSDGAAHKVSLAVLDFSAALKYVCVPRKTSAAFIEGRIKNTSEYELVAGPVSVFMDNSFVAKTQLERVGVNESFTCMLGIDTLLKVSYQNTSRTEHQPERSFAEPSKTTTHTVTTTITNGHSFDLTGLVVRDAIPLGHDKANIKVALQRPEGLAWAKDGEEVTVALAGQEAKVRWAQTETGVGGEKEGFYEWVCDLKAGKKVKLEAEWEIKAPSSMEWEEAGGLSQGREQHLDCLDEEDLSESDSEEIED